MFNIGKWRIELSEIIGSYDSLQNLILDQETLEFYVNKLPIINLSNLQNSDDEKSNSILRTEEINQIKNANQTYRRQIIVLLETHLEALISDFFECVFLAYPIRMYEYLNNDYGNATKGKIDLKEILDVDTKDILIHRLSSRAADIATKGKFSAVLANLERITQHKITSNLSKNLKLLIEQRNRIVHEASNDIVTNKYVHENFDYLYELLMELRNIARAINIVVVDPAEGSDPAEL